MSTKECGKNTHNGKAISWLCRHLAARLPLESRKSQRPSRQRQPWSGRASVKTQPYRNSSDDLPWRIRLFDQRGR